MIFTCCKCYQRRRNNCHCTGEEGGHFCEKCILNSNEGTDINYRKYFTLFLAFIVTDTALQIIVSTSGIYSLETFPIERDLRNKFGTDDGKTDYYLQNQNTQQRAEEVTGLTMENRAYKIGVQGYVREKAENYDNIHRRLQACSTRATKGSSSSSTRAKEENSSSGRDSTREVDQHSGRLAGGRGGGKAGSGGQDKSEGKGKGKGEEKGRGKGKGKGRDRR